MLLSEALPEYDFSERHQRRVDASPEAVFAAIRSVTLAETPIARTLMRLRGLRTGSARPLVEEMDSERWRPYLGYVMCTAASLPP